MNNWAYQRLFLAVLLSGFFIPAYSVGTGLYLGIMGGPATNSSSSQVVTTQTPPPISTGATPKNNQFAGRAFIGYQIGEYGGIEAGATYISSIQYKASLPTCGGLTIRTGDIDLLGKGTYPIWNSFYVFGKAGVAISYTAIPGSFNAACKTDYQHRVRPTFSLGASYDLTQSWVTDISWNQILMGSPLNNINYFALGIAYHFVDRYCGQFLCDD